MDSEVSPYTRMGYITWRCNNCDIWRVSYTLRRACEYLSCVVCPKGRLTLLVLERSLVRRSLS